MLVYILKKKWEYLVFITGPLVVLAEFAYFYVVRGDFFLFLHAHQAYYFGSNLTATFFPFSGFAAFQLYSSINLDMLIAIAILALGIFVLWDNRKEDFVIAFLGLYVFLMNMYAGIIPRYYITFLGLYVWFIVKNLKNVPLWNYKFLKIIIPILIIVGTVLSIRALTNLAIWAS